MKPVGAEYANRKPLNKSTPAPRRESLAIRIYNAPQPNAREGQTAIGFLAASEEWLPGGFGEIRLKVNSEAIDMSRLQLGVMALCADHDTTHPIGRVLALGVQDSALYGSAEIHTGDYAQEKLSEIVAGMRQGISPGFIIHSTSMEPGGQDDFRLSVDRWTPFEISSTPVPRNQYALVTSIEGGQMSAGNTIASLEIVHTSDMIGLSLAAARQAIRQRAGTDRQRQKLGRMLNVFETSLAAGASREQAASDARDSLAAAL